MTHKRTATTEQALAHIKHFIESKARKVGYHIELDEVTRVAKILVPFFYSSGEWTIHFTKSSTGETVVSRIQITVGPEYSWGCPNTWNG